MKVEIEQIVRFLIKGIFQENFDKRKRNV